MRTYNYTSLKSTLASRTVSSAGAATTLGSTNLITNGAIGMHVSFYVSTNGSTVGINPTISYYDEAAAQLYSLLTSTITATGHTVLKLGLGLESTSNIQNDYLPNPIKLGVTHSTTDAVTYSMGVTLFYPENEG